MTGVRGEITDPYGCRGIFFEWAPAGGVFGIQADTGGLCFFRAQPWSDADFRVRSLLNDLFGTDGGLL